MVVGVVGTVLATTKKDLVVDSSQIRVQRAIAESFKRAITTTQFHISVRASLSGWCVALKACPFTN